ncbi:hypothetical protein AVDCRST_MAG81-2271 [uncultured Synechococcales cyanobacterium]|uniref:Uncharacterized protein n=1 Tax=uncultured Synechococcales cyanobacterium TaxID=1936017 RepID=A0A6J4VD67_9CYAN|nr:hypothetical protein AVDCRST_MAG81-2271 [uncultured Synechococcales cyanobacterium]
MVGSLNDYLAGDRGDDALFAGNSLSTLTGRECDHDNRLSRGDGARGACRAYG